LQPFIPLPQLGRLPCLRRRLISRATSLRTPVLRRHQKWCLSCADLCRGECQTRPPHHLRQRRHHKRSKVRAWLHLHFTPTSAFWLNLVERFSSEITRKAIRTGSISQRRCLGNRHPSLPRPPEPQSKILPLDSGRFRILEKNRPRMGDFSLGDLFHCANCGPGQWTTFRESQLNAVPVQRRQPLPPPETD
jgi:hypothetical protein